LIITIASVIFCIPPLSAQLPQLLKDNDPAPLGFAPSSLFQVGSLQYFTTDAGNGFELWRTDGTAAGTFEIADLFPGTTGSNPDSFTAVGSNLFFLANEPGLGRALYRSDGNVIIRVKSISLSTFLGFTNIIGVVANLVILSGDDGIIGNELYSSDGTDPGTILLKNISAGPSSSDPSRGLSVAASKLIFSARTSAEGVEPWVTDGTPLGTIPLANLNPGSGSSQPFPVGVVGTFGLFSANDGTIGRELYRTNGTPGGTTLVKDIETGPGSSKVSKVGSLNSIMILSATSSDGNELWKTDGTLANTVLLKDIEAGPGGSSPFGGITVGNTLFFSASTAALGRELYRTNGLTAGTTLVKDIRPGSLSALLSSGTAINNGKILFTANDGLNGFELWSSDGTEAGTILAKDIFAGAGNSFPTGFVELAVDALFTATGDDLNSALFRSNGTAGGTIKVLDLVSTDRTSDSIPRAFTDSGNKICFVAGQTGFVDTIHCSDGTEAGTAPVHLGNIIFDALGAGDFLSGKLISAATDESFSESEPSLIDLATGSIELIKNINPAGSSAIRKLVASGNKIFFIARDTAQNFELYATDGTTVGTEKLTELLTPTDSTLNSSTVLTPFKGGVLFSAADTASNFEPWFSDGSAAGTAPIKELVSGPSGSLVSGFFPHVVGQEFFFVATQTGGSETLFRSDGTSGGTLPLTNLPTTGISGIDPASIAELNGTLFFGCRIGNLGLPSSEPCKTNNTAQGAEIIKEIVPGNNGGDGSDPRLFTTIGSKVFFYATSPEFGREPFVTDGTDAGTIVLKDINPGAPSSDSGNSNDFPRPIVADGFLYFRADNGVHGRQIWRTDGTPAGTVLLLSSDTSTHNENFSPEDPALINRQIIFRGNSTEFGSEPYIIRDECPGISEFVAGVCGCGVTPLDLNANGVFDCQSTPELRTRMQALLALFKKVKKPADDASVKAKKKAKKLKKNILALLTETQTFASQNISAITVQGGINLDLDLSKAATKIKKTLKLNETVKKDKKKAVKALNNLIAALSE